MHVLRTLKFETWLGGDLGERSAFKWDMRAMGSFDYGKEFAKIKILFLSLLQGVFCRSNGKTSRSCSVICKNWILRVVSKSFSKIRAQTYICCQAFHSLLHHAILFLTKSFQWIGNFACSVYLQVR